MPEMTKTKRPRLSRSDLSDKIFYLFIYVFLGFLALVILYPLYFIIIASISDPDAVLGGPRAFEVRGMDFRTGRFGWNGASPA